MRKMDYLIISILLLNLINNSFASWFAAILVTRAALVYFPWFSLAKLFHSLVFVAVFTCVLVIIGELTPKRFAVKNPSFVIRIGIIPLIIIYYLFYPISALLNRFSHNLINFLDEKDELNSRGMDDHELLYYVKKSSDSGALKKMESAMLQNLITYRNIPIVSVMIPRQKMKGINLSNLPKNIIPVIKKFPYNSIPLYDQIKDNLVGVISKRMLYYRENWEEITSETVRKFASMPSIVPESRQIIDVLQDIYKSGHDIALVTDEYGGVEGFVTYRDILNRLLGRFEVPDYDSADIRRVGRNLFLVNSQVSIDSVNTFFNVHLDAGQAKTLNGFLLEQFQDLPPIGKIYKDRDFEITVKGVSEKKITKVLIKTLK